MIDGSGKQVPLIQHPISHINSMNNPGLSNMIIDYNNSHFNAPSDGGSSLNTGPRVINPGPNHFPLNSQHQPPQQVNNAGDYSVNINQQLVNIDNSITFNQQDFDCNSSFIEQPFAASAFPRRPYAGSKTPETQTEGERFGHQQLGNVATSQIRLRKYRVGEH